MSMMKGMENCISKVCENKTKGLIFVQLQIKLEKVKKKLLYQLPEVWSRL